MSYEYNINQQLQTIISQINQLQSQIVYINNNIASIERDLAVIPNLVNRINQLQREIEYINDRIASIENALRTIPKLFEQIQDRLNSIGSELNKIRGRVDRLEEELQETKKELSNRINAVRDKVMEVEKRVEKAEIRLDEHLSEQDVVLQKNSEALLNNLAMQFVLNVVSKSTSVAHIELSHLNKKPFIVIESNENIRLILISSEISKEDVEVLENLGNALREYTDKEVKYNILTTEVTKSETPAWLYSLQ
jgi:predicted  nucleic acid-binding Zn-ribbon protein